MSDSTYYDDWDSSELLRDDEERKPFFYVYENESDELSVSEWLDKEFAYRVKKSRERVREYSENLAYFKGIQFKSQYSDRYVSEDTYYGSYGTDQKNPKVVDNLVFETMEEKKAKMLRYDPSVTVLPANAEYSDDMGARSIKEMLDTRWYDVGIKRIFAKDQFYVFLYGTSFIYTFWDENEGPLSEEVSRANKIGAKLDDGTSDVRMGDVNYRVISPDRIYPESKESWEEVNDLFYTEYRCPYELERDYPDADIDPERLSQSNSEDSEVQLGDSRDYNGKVLVRHYFHKANKYMSRGKHIVSIAKKILDDQDLEDTEVDNRTGLPFTIHTDIDIPKTFWGRSYIRQIRQAQDQINGLSSQAARSFAMAALPKWLVPWGSCDTKVLTNGHTICRYKGGREPKLATFPSISRDVFEQQDRLRSGIERKSKVYNIYRRDQKIDLSGKALYYLDEQESEVVSEAIQKRALSIIDVANKTIDLMAANYKKADGRMKKIFGEDNTYIIEPFDAESINSKYVARLQNSPSLPGHKSAKIQMMMDIQKERPNAIRDESFLEMLDLAQDKKYVNLLTVASRSASYENDLMIKGKGIPEPKPWEQHLVHYELHIKELQARKFKATGEQVVYAFKEHLLGTEYLMWEMARKNPAFRQKLLMIDYYPIFFKIPDEELQMINRMSMGGNLSEGESKMVNDKMQEMELNQVVEEDPSMMPIDPRISQERVQ